MKKEQSTSKSLMLLPAKTLLARITIFGYFAALPTPFVFAFAFEGMVRNPLVRYGSASAVLAVLILAIVNSIGSLYTNLRVENGRLILHRWYGDKSVNLTECTNIQWAYDSPTGTTSGVPQFHLVLTCQEGGGLKRTIWPLGLAWKMAEFEQFTWQVRRLRGLPGHDAKADLKPGFTKLFSDG